MRAVKRINDPRVLPGPGVEPAFFAKDPVPGKCRLQTFDDNLFRGFIEIGDERAVGLAFDRIDRSEILFKQRSRLAGRFCCYFNVVCIHLIRFLKKVTKLQGHHVKEDRNSGVGSQNSAVSRKGKKYKAHYRYLGQIFLRSF
jgi:hypothetical protein